VIGQYYPRALEHLQVARTLKAQMASAWSAAVDGGLIGESVVTDPDGSGRILAYVDWPPGCREELTAQIREFVIELRGCLDSLVIESVEAFSVLQRPRDPSRCRFFPVVDSMEGFEALLKESCLDGVLRLQFEMVIDCQPFQPDSGDQNVERFRNGLRQLLAWEDALKAGKKIGAWATPVTPQIHAKEPAILCSLEVQEAGVIDDVRVLATYRLHNYEIGHPVSGQAGTYVDLCLTDAFVPADGDDTFEKHLKMVLEVVTSFVVSFAWLSSQVPGSRRVLLGDRPGTEKTWMEAAKSSRRWSAEELAGLAASDIGLGRVIGADEFTLVVSTPNGVFERVIPQATPLREHARRGIAAEIAVQDAAATWGLPDFVMAPKLERKGSAVREVGDALLVVGKRGVIVQSKARCVDPGSPEREASWVKKQIDEALNQINGTLRRLKTRETQMQNGRGRHIRIDGPSIKWVGVVIIEHPNPPECPVQPGVRRHIPLVVLLRRDWEFLFGQLRSTHAVINYLHRVGEPTEILGKEPERYYELAAADATAAPGPVDPSLEGLGQVQSLPLLPMAPSGSDDDEAHGMVRIMLEDIATTRVDPEKQDAQQEVLGLLDSLHVGLRTELGRLLLDALATSRDTQSDSTWWRFRTFVLGSEQAQLGFGVCSVLNEMTSTAFTAWLRLRHHERGYRTDISDLTSIGVLLTPRNDGYRDWDTSVGVVRGDLELTEEELQQDREIWNSRH
jgi:putative component of membrane protein insertase Oxa1/YidC/SpoIIIJ protein YidD